jgi:membrane-associated progesterone receptor component
MSDKDPTAKSTPTDDPQTWSQWFISELTSNPINGILILAILFLIYKIFKSDNDSSPKIQAEPPMPRLKKRDMTLKDLRKYDGTGPEGRVLVAVLGKIYDVTKGKRFYGPGGPYAGFAGRDASRGLATFNVDAINDEYDDLSDLKNSELEQVREWELQFSEKYEFVGKLMKPGEEPTFYSDASSDEEEETTAKSTEEEKKSQ